MNLPNNFRITELDLAKEQNLEVDPDLLHQCAISAILAINSIAANGLPLYAICSSAEGVAYLQSICHSSKIHLTNKVTISTALPDVLPGKYQVVNLTAYY